MKTLEANSIRIGSNVGDSVGIEVLLQNVVRLKSSGAVPRVPCFDII
jgi:hypothetical protein